MSRLIPILLIASTLTACASGPTPMPAPRMPPAGLTTRCPALPPPASGQSANLLANHVEIALLYHQCRDRHSALSDWANHKQE